MKCQACTYEYEPSYDNKYNEITLKGHKPFIKIYGTFLIENDPDWGLTHKEEIDIYACPECGTLRLEQ